MRKRDYNLDFFRGIAAIWIIFIHTCFWSGGSYLPDYIRTLSLFIDVPLFVFISGASFNFSNSVLKNIKGLVNLWLKYLTFLILYFILIFILDQEYLSINNIINAIFFSFTENKLMVVEGSMWFVFMFFIVSIFGSIIVCLYNKYCKKEDFVYLVIFLFIIYGISLFRPNFIFLSTNVLLYLFLYCLGYYLYNLDYSIKKAVVNIGIILCLFLLLVKVGPYNFCELQMAKVDNHIVYLLYSMFSINIMLLLKNRINVTEKNIFSKIGKNALLFYFCQGIGGSLIYYLYNYISNYSVIVILFLMFISNIIITIICVFIMHFLHLIMKKCKLYFDDKNLLKRGK